MYIKKANPVLAWAPFCAGMKSRCDGFDWFATGPSHSGTLQRPVSISDLFFGLKRSKKS